MRATREEPRRDTGGKACAVLRTRAGAVDEMIDLAEEGLQRVDRLVEEFQAFLQPWHTFRQFGRPAGSRA